MRKSKDQSCVNDVQQAYWRYEQMGYGPEDWHGRPVIAILNTWSDLNQCHAHFPDRVEHVRRGVLQADLGRDEAGAPHGDEIPCECGFEAALVWSMQATARGRRGFAPGQKCVSIREHASSYCRGETDKMAAL